MAWTDASSDSSGELASMKLYIGASIIKGLLSVNRRGSSYLVVFDKEEFALTMAGYLPRCGLDFIDLFRFLAKKHGTTFDSGTYKLHSTSTECKRLTPVTPGTILLEMRL